MAEAPQSRPYRRKLKRHAIGSTVEVHDKLRHCCVGRLVNIHHQGLMLMAQAAIEADRFYQLDLRLPQKVNGRDLIHLGVDCLWVRPSDDQKQYWAGFQIIDKSSEADADITALIALLGESTDK